MKELELLVEKHFANQNMNLCIDFAIFVCKVSEHIQDDMFYVIDGDQRPVDAKYLFESFIEERYKP